MTTLTIQIGNTDNKLTQQQWSDFVLETNQTIAQYAQAVHFFGGSPNWYAWQNVCWVIEIGRTLLPVLKRDLVTLKDRFNQESLAWTLGETVFI